MTDIATAPTDRPSAPCPLNDGLHLWVWPGGRSEGWKTAKQQADRALALGAVGIIAQSGLSAPIWLQGRDQGDSVPRVEIFQRAGLQVTAGLGLDGASATRTTIVHAILQALSMPGVNIMGDEEKVFWETAPGRALAKAIVDDVLASDPMAWMRGTFCPWWKPLVHTGGSDREFWGLFLYLFCQVYGAHGVNAPNDDTIAMLAESRREYPQRGIPAEFVRMAFQLYAHSEANASRIVFSGESVMAGWDVEELDVPMRRILLARMWLLAHGFAATVAGIMQWQRSAGLRADGVVGPLSLAKMGL